MEIKASLNNLRLTPRKARLVTNLVTGKSAIEAKNQLRFLVKKPAPILLKLLNSALANAKHSFSLKEDNLYIKSILVEAGPSLKRWLPRAMGRATPLLKRTCSVKIILDEILPTTHKIKKSRVKSFKKEALTAVQPAPPEEKIEKSGIPLKEEIKEELEHKKPLIPRPFGSSSQAKKRIFSRQTFGNIKKIFRRKSI